MLKRLLTAVFVLGLFMALSGTAFSGPNDVPGEGPKSDKLYQGPTTTTVKSILKTPGFVTQTSRALTRTPDNTPTPPRPSGNEADTNACYEQDYFTPNACGAYRINMYGAGGPFPDDAMATKFDVFAYPTHSAQINGAYGVIRYAKRAGGAGLPVRLQVFDDAGGMPGTMLYSETYVLPAVSAATWFYFPFTTPVVITGSNFHISIGNDPSMIATDSLALRTSVGNDAGPPCEATGRSTYYDGAGPTWYTMAAAFGDDTGFDLALVSDQCEYYSVCYDNSSHIPAPGFIGHLVDVPADYWADGSTLNGVSQYFSATGPETLKTVRFRHYDYSGSYPGLFYSGASTNGLSMSVYPDDGSGNLDYSGGPLATVSMPGGVGLFPTTGLAANGYNSLFFDFSSFNLVLFGGYHIALSVTSDIVADGVFLYPMTYETAGAFYTDGTGGSVNFTAPGATWQRMYANTTWMSDPSYAYGIDYAFGGLRPTLCVDEFSLCDVGKSYMDQVTRLLYMDNCNLAPFYGSRNGIAGKFIGGQVNRVDKVRFQLTDETYDAYPDVPNSVRVSVYQSITGGTPSVVWTTVLTNADLTFLPGWTEVVIPGGAQVLNEWFVAVEPLFTLDGDNEWLYFARERVGDTPLITGQPGGGMWVKLCADDLWYQNNIIAAADNFICEAEFCSIPPTEIVCGAADDYPTNAHDYGRTGHSNVSLSDAYCNLNWKWAFTDPNFGSTLAGGGAVANNAPIIYDTFVVSVQNSKINILNLNTGLPLATFTGNVAPYYMAVSLVRSTPTIAVIDVAGTPTPVLFYGGGNSMMAVQMIVGFPALWDLRSVNAIAKGYAAGEVSSGFSNWTAPVVANIGGTDMVFFGTQNSQIFGADAETGFKMWGTTLVSNPVRNLAFDGASLYTATIAAPPVVPDGDVYKLDAATGAIQKQLTVDAGLKGALLPGWAGSTNESFADQLAVSNGEVWTVSAFYVPEFDDEGVLYNINAATFAVTSYSGTQHFYQGGGLTVGANLMLDAQRVIVAGGTTWSSTPLGGTMIAHNRFTGAIAWISDSGPLKTTYGNLSNGFMTCEPGGAADEIYVFNTGGFMSCFDGNTGSEVFSRRIDYLSLGFNSQGAGGAISSGGIVVFGTYAGQVIAMEKTTDRGRLEIMDYTPTNTVSFGAAPSILVTLPDIYTNTGCGTITGTYTIDLASNGSVLGASQWSGFDVSDRASSIADQLTQNSVKAFKGSGLVTVSMESVSDETASRSSMNRAALAMPPYLNGAATAAFVVNPGDTFDIVLDVNQSLIPRGPNNFYISFDSDDPDFFLNDLTKDPQIRVTLVGGCLIDTTHLLFGAGSANLQAVANSGRLGTGDWNPTPGNIKIAGDAVSFYQGTYVYGVNRNRVALNSQDWWSGGGEADSWVSMQADPNRCSDDCKPALQTGVSLGSASLDGITYAPLTGNLVCKDYVDSVLIYDPDGAGPALWNWLNFETAYFDNDSTMGLYVSTSTFGVVDAPAGFTALNDVSVEVMKVKTRNGQVLNNWKFGVGIDYDVVNPDTTNIDRTISTVYTYGANGAAPRSVWGIVKLPFGGGCAGSSYEPIKNARSLARGQSMTTPTTNVPSRGNGFVDSSYFWMSLPIGASSQGAMNSADDQDAFATIVEHSFTAGGDSIQFAVAHFAKLLVPNPQLSSNYTSLANLLNQWMGFGRGDVNNDGVVNLADIIYLADYVASSGPGPIPFAHLGDVDGDGLTNAADVTYLMSYYFYYGPCPVGEFIIQ